jgi:hypothetical protein
MTHNRNLKRAVRAGMKVTGEKYTVALRRHLEESAVSAGVQVDGPDTISGTVREWFVEELRDSLSPHDVELVDRAILVHPQETPRSPLRETAELCSLLDHAYSAWCGEAVLATRDDGMAQGLQSVNPIFEPLDAGYVLARVREYEKNIRTADLPPEDSQEAADAQQANEDVLEILDAFARTLEPIVEYAGRDTMELPEAMLKTAAQMSARVFVLAVEADVVADVQADAIELKDRLGWVSGRQRARR